MRIFRSIQLTICCLIGCGVIVCAQTRPPDLTNKQAPAFVRVDLAGRRVGLEQYRGKVVLLNFWATWCGPCQVELPRFAAWQKTYGARGFQVLAVSMDDSEAPVRRTVRRLHLDFPVVMGDANLGEEYGGVLGLPITFLIDRDGRIVKRIKGGSDLKELEDSVKSVLNSK
jgi:cytochrome c biogenesis protein CcmG, thiol:disulfide interchange protein DsbE